MQKILFNKPLGLQAAVLDGSKTMPRRVSKCQLSDDVDISVGLDDKGKVIFTIMKYGCYVSDIRPKYQIGEVVAVAQAYRDLSQSWEREHMDIASDIIKSPGYNNSMFVKAELMPVRIVIDDIGLERLQDISDEDCMKEGVQSFQNKNGQTIFTYHGGSCFTTPRLAFASLIEKTCGRGTWDRNPYVLPYSFHRVS